MVDAQGFLPPELRGKTPAQEMPEVAMDHREEETAVVRNPEERPSVTASVERAQVTERSTIAPVVQPTVHKDPELLEIEEVLANNMTDLFLALPQDRKQAFKDGGEEAARKIQRLVDQGKASARHIFDIIRDWLRGLPMINRFFLEQEAKIKTDEIVAYIERKGGEVT